jgi:hypothetical protein
MCELPGVLRNSYPRRLVLDHMRQLRLRTTHLKPAERNFSIRCHSLSLHDAAHQYAFGGYMSLNVMQYYYVRHHKRLGFSSRLPCVVENGPHHHRSYYPLEVLEVVENKQ